MLCGLQGIARGEPFAFEGTTIVLYGQWKTFWLSVPGGGGGGKKEGPLAHTTLSQTPPSTLQGDPWERVR